MNQNHQDLGKLILRLAVGGLVLMHGIAKLHQGTGFIEARLADQGLPGFLAWGVYVGEIVAPLMLILGFHARLGGLLVAFNLLVAIGLVHLHELFALNPSGGWALELQGMFLFGAVAVALLGPGRFSLSKK